MTLPGLSKPQLSWVALLLTTVATMALDHPLRINVTDGESGDPVACRIHLEDGQGKTVKAANLPCWNDHFVCGGSVRLNLAKGVYQFEIDREPEYALTAGQVEVAEGPGEVILNNSINRIANLAAENWWSGEMHLHRGPELVPLLMQAEDLHIACANTWWNDGNPWATTPLPANPQVQFDGNRFYDGMCGEDERGGGALLFGKEVHHRQSHDAFCRWAVRDEHALPPRRDPARNAHGEKAHSTARLLRHRCSMVVHAGGSAVRRVSHGSISKVCRP